MCCAEEVCVGLQIDKLFDDANPDGSDDISFEEFLLMMSSARHDGEANQFASLADKVTLSHSFERERERERESPDPVHTVNAEVAEGIRAQ